MIILLLIIIILLIVCPLLVVHLLAYIAWFVLQLLKISAILLGLYLVAVSIIYIVALINGV